MTKKGWIIFAVLCAAILGGLIYMSQQGKVNVDHIDADTLQTADEGAIGDHVIGKTDSKVVLIEYGDFQCPGCRTAAPVLKTVAEKYKDKIAFVFRNYPLTSIHPNALAAASAAEAAGLQGKYWEYHDKLYANQASWQGLSGTSRTDYFVEIANNLGLDTGKLRTDIENDAVRSKINLDIALGKKKGVMGTPAIYLNGKSVSDVYVKDGKIVDANTEGAQQAWSSAEALEKAVIIPALKEHGISVDEK